MKYKNTLPIVLSFLMLPTTKRWFLKADAGITIFFGDVKRYDYIPDFESPSEVQFAFGGGFGKEISNVFNLRTQLVYGKLSGHKQSAHYYFKSNIILVNLLADINLVNLFTGSSNGDTPLNIFSSIGIGYTNWDTHLRTDNPNAKGEDLMAENNDGSISIPLSIHAEYALNNFWSIYIEGGLHVVFSDEVDAKAGGISYDMINYNAIGICYKFKGKKKTHKSRIKYSLDPALYETTPEKQVEVEEKEEVAIEKPAENQTEIVSPTPEKEEIATIVVIPPKEEVKEVAEQIIETPEPVEEPKESIAQKEEKQIDHQLERQGLEKEAWATEEEAWPNIEFSVQIAAGHKPLDIQTLKEKHQVKEDLVEKYDGEWYRYSAGHFDKLWKARELRNKMRSVLDIKDAFIVVYRDQERISLVEALNYTARVQEEEKPVSLAETNKNEAAEKVYEMMPLVYNIPQQGLIIGVQILSLTNDEYPMGVFKGIYGFEQKIIVNYQSPWYKLIVVGFDQLEEAQKFQTKARNAGFIDSFIVSFNNGKRISIKQLKEELKK